LSNHLLIEFEVKLIRKLSVRTAARSLIMKISYTHASYYGLKYQTLHHQNFSKYDEDEQKILKEIQKKGYYIIPNFVDKEFCEKCIKDADYLLENKKEHIVHNTSDIRIYGVEKLSPTFKPFAENEFLNNIANHYNQMETLNAWTQTSRVKYFPGNTGASAGWHRDSKDRQFKAILYLNDVTENNGPYQIIEGSHKWLQILKDNHNSQHPYANNRFTDEEIEKILKNRKEKLKTIIGKAGTVILKDCSAIHRGSPLKSEGVRYVITNYFFVKQKINRRLVEYFAPVVNPEQVLKLVKPNFEPNPEIISKKPSKNL